MLGYFLLIFLTIAAWVLVVVSNKKLGDSSGLFTIAIVLGLLFTVLLALASGNFAIKTQDAYDFMETRTYCQDLVNSISDTMSPATIASIISEAKNTNNRIESNRKHCNDVMWGFLYNKKIAEVEPIKIPKYKFSVEVEE